MGDIALSSLGLIFMYALFSNINSIAGWDRGACLWLWGLAEVSSGMAQCLFAGIVSSNREYLLNGKLDRLLLRPINPLFQIIGERLSLAGLPLAIMGLLMMILGQVEHPLGAISLLMMCTAILGGIALMGALLIAMSAIGFIAHHTGTMSGLLIQAISFSRYPMGIFPTPLRWALFPMALLSYLPVGSILKYDGLHSWGVLQPLIAMCCLLISYQWWMLLSQHYRSTGH